MSEARTYPHRLQPIFDSISLNQTLPMRSTILAFILALSITCFSQQINIIPQPVSVVTKPGTFTITKKTKIVAKDDEDRKTANLLNIYLQQAYGFKLDIDQKEGKNFIRFSTKRFIQAPDKDAYSCKH
jgi:hexosaminidase